MELHYSLLRLSFSLRGEEEVLSRVASLPAFTPFRLVQPPAKTAFGLHLYGAAGGDAAFPLSRRGSLSLFLKGADGSLARLVHAPGSDLYHVRLSQPGDGPQAAGLSPQVLGPALYACYCLSGLAHGRVPVHAACVVHQGRALLFLGPSGTGKSTQARLWLRHLPHSRLLGDDNVLLGLADGELRTEGGLRVSGSPWDGSPWGGDFPSPGDFPVLAGLRLHQAPYNRLAPLPSAPALQALLAAFPPFLLRLPAYRAQAIALSSALLARQPLRQFHCLPLPSAPLQLHQHLYK